MAHINFFLIFAGVLSPSLVISSMGLDYQSLGHNSWFVSAYMTRTKQFSITTSGYVSLPSFRSILVYVYIDFSGFTLQCCPFTVFTAKAKFPVRAGLP